MGGYGARFPVKNSEIKHRLDFGDKNKSNFFFIGGLQYFAWSTLI